MTYLVLHAGSAGPRTHLAALFWPDSTRAQARTNLRRELYKLRLFLGGIDCIAINGDTLGWQDVPTCWVDVRVFRQESDAALAARGAGKPEEFLRHVGQAMDAYRGDLLPGNYDDWILEQRAELRSECARLCAVAVEELLDAGNVAGALPAARRIVQLEPLEETGYRLLMEVQAAAGENAAVMNTYQRCSAVLQRELGVAPNAATAAFRETAVRRNKSVVPKGGMAAAHTRHYVLSKTRTFPAVQGEGIVRRRLNVDRRK